VKLLALWLKYSRGNWPSKTAKFLGGKRPNELLHSLLNFEFLNPRRSKLIQYIEHLDTVDRAMPFQYSEFPSETVSLMGQIL